MLFVRYLISAFAALLVTSLSFSQVTVKEYKTQWAKVEELANEKNLPQSALAEVKKIYALAKKENQEAQVIKALVYMATLQVQTREDNHELSISEFEKEVGVAKEPSRSILKSLIAELYWMYFSQHRWELYNRTQTTGFVKEDIATWSADDFHKTISNLYLQSLGSSKILQETSLGPYDAIIIKGNVRHLRPTLYDLLAHRALSYFTNTERDIRKPAFAFEIDDPEAFAPAAEFVNHKFTSKDSFSLHHKALVVYQDLLAFHLKDENPDALIDADIDRLNFVRRQGVMESKDSLFKNAMEGIATKHPRSRESAQALYFIAQVYHEQAGSYQPYGDTTHRFARVKAKEILQRVLSQYDSAGAEGWYNSYNLLQQINAKQLSFQVEKVNLPGQAFRMLVNYGNFNTLYLRILKADEQFKNELRRHDEKYWPSLIAKKPLKEWQQSLPITNDLQQHAVEIKVDGMPQGDYIIVASTNASFDKAAIIAAQIFYVSRISFIRNHLDHFIVDRETGEPLANAKVQVWEQVYDYKKSDYIKRKGPVYTTDGNGYFRMAKKKERENNYLFEITHAEKRLFMNEQLNDYYYYEPGNDKKETPQTFLFADRSIYRPGQTFYFKGIVITTAAARDNRILTNHTTTVYLKNANHENIDSINLVTNEFGSYSGKFQLPQSVLNGQFSIETKTAPGMLYFRIEDYKRPKFYVELEKPKEIYKVNDTITVEGFAKAYAGNNINGAKVVYRVVRQPRFIYPWLYWRSWLPRSEPMEIAHGEITTDAEGRFIIRFAAIPDRKIDRKLEPVFDYRIYADVTDINGETRSGESVVSVSYNSILLHVTIPETIPVDSTRLIRIRTENTAGVFVPALVKVSFTKLIPEQRLIRNRFWQRPDQFVMTREEYVQNFPHDEYDNELDPMEWQRGEKVFEKTDSSRESSEFGVQSLPAGEAGSELGAGHYLVEVETKDEDGNPVKTTQHVELYDEQARQLSSPSYVWFNPSRPIEPGETTSNIVGSSAENVFLIQQVDRTTVGREENIEYDFSQINNERKTFRFTATEMDRGGYGVNYLFVKHNRFYQVNDIIKVPWTNKDLKVEYATFRDKTLPGSEEKWTVKISGYKTEKATAEMLASMYDASLDQFAPHNWSVPGIWPVYSARSYWNGTQNFGALQSDQRWMNENPMLHFEKIYDRLISAYNYYEFSFRRDGQAPSLESKVTANISLGEVTAGKPRSTSKEGDMAANQEEETSEPEQKQNKSTFQPRTNFNETAFFIPDLKTDSDGSIEFSFTMPEALTRWKFQALTHTKDLAIGLSQKEIITQKELMVQPNMPRYLREGDRIELNTKIVNLSDKEITGQAELQLFDATTGQSVDGWFQNVFPNQYFTVAAGQSGSVAFPIQIPFEFNKAFTWRVIARGGDFSDGEEASMPVLTNRMLVTETITLPMRGTGTKNFSFDKLLNSGNSETIKHHALTVEYTSNPAWYAVQALPYLMQYHNESAEQNWNLYYANSLAAMIANSSPRIKAVFEKWKTLDTAALLSNLQKNQELKSILLEETPWVLQAKTEAEQKRNIALLFDMVKMGGELSSSLEKLRQMQSPNGGFVWFKGGPDDRYITQYIVTGIGHLRKLNAAYSAHEKQLDEILNTAIAYLDRKIKEDYDRLVKSKAKLDQQQIGYYEIQYLYMRSFFPGHRIPQSTLVAYNYYLGQAKKFWTRQNKYMQGMIALALHRKNDKTIPAAILKSLKETSIVHEELGMYWKDETRGWFWHQAPIEKHALMIEAFWEISKDTKTVDDLRTWLLKHKQTNSWETTKATAEAVYALLIPGSDWLSEEPVVTIKLGNTTISNQYDKTEAGTGYFKQTIEGPQVNPAMGNITVNVASGNQQHATSSTWGAVYWQYFEDLDKITNAATPLNLQKKLFVETNTDRGPVLTPINDGELLKIGDKIKVRIELRVDRDMEYVHMKDMRASALEPVNVLSGYKWQGGLGYYETTRDASTSFFFNYLRRGTYVFEYALFVTHAGQFSNGITTIQSMYAPEFSAHSEGVRINTE